MASITITGKGDASKEIMAQAADVITDFTFQLKIQLLMLSPVGPSGGTKSGVGLKRNWRIEKTKITGGGVVGGVSNELDYVNRVNVEALRHIPGEQNKPEWNRSFGSEYGKDRAPWAKRVYGTDTSARRYGRGYRRAVIKNLPTEIFEARFIERSIEAAGGKVLGTEGSGANTTYFVDINRTI